MPMNAINLKLKWFNAWQPIDVDAIQCSCNRVKSVQIYEQC